MSVVNVGNPSLQSGTSLIIREITLGKNHMNAVNVENLLARNHP